LIVSDNSSVPVETTDSSFRAALDCDESKGYA